MHRFGILIIVLFLRVFLRPSEGYGGEVCVLLPEVPEDFN